MAKKVFTMKLAFDCVATWQLCPWSDENRVCLIWLCADSSLLLLSRLSCPELVQRPRQKKKKKKSVIIFSLEVLLCFPGLAWSTTGLHQHISLFWSFWRKKKKRLKRRLRRFTCVRCHGSSVHTIVFDRWNLEWRDCLYLYLPMMHSGSKFACKKKSKKSCWPNQSWRAWWHLKSEFPALKPLTHTSYLPGVQIMYKYIHLNIVGHVLFKVDVTAWLARLFVAGFVCIWMLKPAHDHKMQV